ncbi:RecX family transcriptional regulator [Candidatus Saccharibacteria bacterium]|nr:RecX family transcriptional regulator [Candidatus Saccharibacteria bacterium]
MVKITDIKQQVRLRHRYSIYLDGKFAFGLSQSTLLGHGLKIGQELSVEDIGRLKQDAEVDKAYSLVLGQLARRPRSEKEVRDYLKRKQYAEELINKLVKRIYDVGYLDDTEFAQRWVYNRRLLKPTSIRRLQQELRVKGVNDQIIAGVLAQDDTDDKQVIAEVIKRKRRQTRYQDDQKLMAYLIRQGYDYQDIKDALR